MPSPDLSAAEVEAATRVCEHLAYLSQQGREALEQASGTLAQLHKLCSAMSMVSPDGGVPSQHGKVPLYQQWQGQLNHLETVSAETKELLAAAADAETAAEPRAALAGASLALAGVLTRVQHCRQELRSEWEIAPLLPFGEVLFTSDMEHALEAAVAMVEAACTELLHSQHAAMPGWHHLAEAFQAVASGVASPADATAPSTSGAEALQQLMASTESIVASALVWAQNTCGSIPAGGEAEHGQHEASVDESWAELLPKALDELNRRMGLDRAMQLVHHGSDAFAALAALADSHDPAMLSAGAAVVHAAAPLLRLMHAALWQLGARYLALHLATSKLGYIASSLFAGVVQEGFCMPDAGGGESSFLDASLVVVAVAQTLLMTATTFDCLQRARPQTVKAKSWRAPASARVTRGVPRTSLMSWRIRIRCLGRSKRGRSSKRSSSRTRVQSEKMTSRGLRWTTILKVLWRMCSLILMLIKVSHCFHGPLALRSGPNESLHALSSSYSTLMLIGRFFLWCLQQMTTLMRRAMTIN